MARRGSCSSQLPGPSCSGGGGGPRRWELPRCPAGWVVGLVVVTVVLFCWSMTVGAFPVSFSDVVKTLIGEGTDASWFIVGELRLPRALVGLLVGAAFGLSGALLQTIARNPLATPDVI